jgi:hypothetical protein
VHNHINDAGGIYGEAVPPAQVVKAMSADQLQKRPDKILEKVYHRNAEKIFAKYRGTNP